MNEPNEAPKKRNLALKIILPIIIVGIIALIGVLKNQENNAAILSDEGFILEAGSIDLEQLKSYGLPIVIDFGSEGCIPCDLMAPVLKKLNQEWQGKVIVKFVDIKKYPDAAYNFPVSVIPTQLFFNAQGNPYVPSEKMSQIPIPFNLYSEKDTGLHVYTTHEGGLSEEQLRSILEEMGVK